MNIRAIIYRCWNSAAVDTQDNFSFLADTCVQNGWHIVDALSDLPQVNRKRQQRLPARTTLLRAVARHEVDVVLVVSLHHLGTSVETLLETLAELDRYG